MRSEGDRTLSDRGHDNSRGAAQPVEVELNLAIRNIGPIDELKEVFSIDCYFRQTWFDSRLQFNTR